MSQVMHIEATEVDHVMFNWFAVPPTAKCGDIIWCWTDDDEPWEWCGDCLDVHADEGYPDPD